MTRAAASAASRFRCRWACVNGTSSAIRSPARSIVRRAPSCSCSSVPSSSTSPPGPNVTVSTSPRRCGVRSASPAGTTAVPPGFRPAISSALAAAIASSDPSSSRWTGPTLTITATSGSAIAASSAIWPSPRMPISSTSTSVSAAASRISSGRPISVLKFAREATVRPSRGAGSRAGGPSSTSCRSSR